jgi:amino acid transporter
VRTDDVFFFGWQTIALSYIVFTVLAWSAYPGASMELASLLAMIGGAAIGACYALLATVYPRSGAEYVFLSRSLHPAIGFALSFSFAFWQMFYIGINGAFLSLFAISPVLAGIGVQAHNQTLLDVANWFAGKWGIFVCGSLMVLGMGYLHYRGAARYFRWQRWASYASIVSLLVTVVVLILAATGVLDFRANFDRLAGAGAYERVIATGREAGVAPAPGFSLGETLKFILWPAFSLWFAITAVSFSGEVKNVQRGQLVGIVGSVVAMGISFIVLMALYRAAFGSDFILSASATGVPLEAPPFVPFFTAIAGGNLLLTVVMSLWVLIIAVFVGGTAFLYPSRTLVAWSIDGMAPEKLADVNDRYHSPHWAILVCVLVGEVTLALFAFTTLLGFVSGFLGMVDLLPIRAPRHVRVLSDRMAHRWRAGADVARDRGDGLHRPDALPPDRGHDVLAQPRVRDLGSGHRDRGRVRVVSGVESPPDAPWRRHRPAVRGDPDRVGACPWASGSPCSNDTGRCA